MNSGSKPCGDVEDAGHGADLDAVSASWIAVSFGQNAEGLEAGDGVLDAHAEPAQGVVVGALILCQGSFLGFLVGNFNTGVILLEPLVTVVGIDMGGLWQGRPATADFEIVNPARRGL